MKWDMVEKTDRNAFPEAWSREVAMKERRKVLRLACPPHTLNACVLSCTYRHTRPCMHPAHVPTPTP